MVMGFRAAQDILRIGWYGDITCFETQLTYGINRFSRDLACLYGRVLEHPGEHCI